MATQVEMKEKWGEVLDYARQHATGEGFKRGHKWLEDSFNEYLKMSDETPGYSMGGLPGSMHNREVLAERIVLELGNGVGGRHAITEDQEVKLRNVLLDIARNPQVSNSLKV